MKKITKIAYVITLTDSSLLVVIVARKKTMASAIKSST
jgi:hypothetical protein